VKRKKFVKLLMGLGISRNTATAAADAASRAEIPLIKAAGRIQTMRLLFGIRTWHKWSMQAFDRALLEQAKRTPARIKPLRTKRPDGLRIEFSLVDEWATTRLEFTEAERQRTLKGRWVGIDLAKDPDLVAHHLGDNVQVMTKEEHAALHGGGTT